MPSPPPSLLGLFVKHPTPGRVKTRLAATLGPDAAAALYAAFTQDLLTRFRNTAVSRVLAFAPTDSSCRTHFEQLAQGNYDLWPQSDGTLGDRLHTFFETHLSQHERVVVIGSDSPTLPIEFVTRALGLLGERDCVLGPASDGGYYLIGLRKPCRTLFDGIDWGTSRVLGQTVARIRTAGLSLHLLPIWYDVDMPDDLAFLRGHLAALRQAGAAIEVPATERVLSEIAARVPE